MLCKEACMRCIRVNSFGIPWNEEDDKAWVKDHEVICPPKLSPGQCAHVIMTWSEPPEWCPYDFEHMIAESA